MKRFFIPTILFLALFLVEMEVNAQRGRIYRGRPVYRSRPMVSIGIGGAFGGFYGGPRFYGYGPVRGVGVNVNVAVPPSGASVRNLPPASRKVEINGITYYEHNDLYFRERRDGGFEVVDAPVGALLKRLPMGAKLQKIDGKYYYQKNGVTYYRQLDDTGRPFYEVIGKENEISTYDEYETDIIEDQYNERHPDRRIADIPETKPDIEVTDKSKAGQGGTVRPQAGDRFEELPRNSSKVKEGLFKSPNGIYYKEVLESDRTVYEVVDGS